MMSQCRQIGFAGAAPRTFSGLPQSVQATRYQVVGSAAPVTELCNGGLHDLASSSRSDGGHELVSDLERIPCGINRDYLKERTWPDIVHLTDKRHQSGELSIGEVPSDNDCLDVAHYAGLTFCP
jgi:hypothetical protein